MNEQISKMTLSKQIHGRLHSAQTVLSTLLAEASTLSDELGGLYGPWLVDPSPTPFASLLQAFHGRLSESRDRLAEVAERHLGVETGAGEIQLRSEEASAFLGATITALRETFRGVYGCKQLAHFGFPGRTPARAAVLLKSSRELHQRLADPDLELPPSRVPDFDLDCGQLARKIEPPIDDLDDALQASRDHSQEVEASARLQDEAVAEFNDVFLQVAGSLESWLRMAGRDTMADAVRPSRRRPGLIH